MGGAASTNQSNIDTDFISQSYANCPSMQAENILEIASVQCDPNINCKTSTCSINQNSGVTDTCLINQLQQNTAQAISKMSADVQGGLGFQASTNVSDIVNQIQAKTMANCGNLSSTNYANIGNIASTACQFYFVQSATDQSACQIQQLQQLAANVQSTQDSLAKGATLAGILFGGGAGLIILVIVGVVAYSMFKGKKGKKGEQGGGSGCFELKYCWPLLIILILLLVVFYVCSRRRRPFTLYDIERFQDTVSNAKTIANAGRVPNDNDIQNGQPMIRAIGNKPIMANNTIGNGESNKRAIGNKPISRAIGNGPVLRESKRAIGNKPVVANRTENKSVARNLICNSNRFGNPELAYKELDQYYQTLC
jgi:uncharacterized membrane protein